MSSLSSTIKFNYISLPEKGQRVCYSSTTGKYFKVSQTAHIAMDTPEQAAKIDVLTLDEIIQSTERQNIYLKAKYGETDYKAKRPCIQVFASDDSRFALKDRTSYSCWNGCITVDLDIDKYTKRKITGDLYNLLITLIQSSRLKTNLLYAERSNSGVGIHLIFYYDIDHSETNFQSCAEYTKDELMNLSDVLFEVFNTKGVFDDIYKRPFQRIYLTTNDYKKFNPEGTYPIAVLDSYKVTVTKTDEFYEYSPDDVVSAKREKSLFIPIDNKIKYDIDMDFANRLEVHHRNRFLILCALYVMQETKADAMNIIRERTFYRKGDNQNIKQAEKQWDDIAKMKNIDSFWVSRGLWYLSLCGIKYKYVLRKKSNGKVNLQDDEYLSDKLQEISDALNKYKKIKLISGTGTGKTQLLGALSRAAYCNKSMVVISPYNAHLDLYKKQGFQPITNANYGSMSTNGKYVVIWDQAVRSENMKFIINADLVAVDEIHRIFDDKIYRDSAVEMDRLLHNVKNNLMLMTATDIPDYTNQFVNHSLVYTRNDNRNFVIKYYKLAGYEREDLQGSWNLISHFIRDDKFDHTVFFTNQNFMNIIRMITTGTGNIDNEPIGIYASKRGKYTHVTDIEQLTDDEKLSRRINLMTSSGWEGLNIMTENKKIRIVILNENLMPHHIEQIIGRFRKSNNTYEVDVVDVKSMYVLNQKSVIAIHNLNAAVENAINSINVLDAYEAKQKEVLENGTIDGIIHRKTQEQQDVIEVMVSKMVLSSAGIIETLRQFGDVFPVDIEQAENGNETYFPKNICIEMLFEGLKNIHNKYKAKLNLEDPVVDDDELWRPDLICLEKYEEAKKLHDDECNALINKYITHISSQRDIIKTALYTNKRQILTLMLENCKRKMTVLNNDAVLDGVLKIEVTAKKPTGIISTVAEYINVYNTPWVEQEAYLRVMCELYKEMQKNKVFKNDMQILRDRIDKYRQIQFTVNECDNIYDLTDRIAEQERINCNLMRIGRSNGGRRAGGNNKKMYTLENVDTKEVYENMTLDDVCDALQLKRTTLIYRIKKDKLEGWILTEQDDFKC